MPDLAVAPDLWLPERLAKLAVFIDLERDTYRRYLATVAHWLNAVRDPILNPAGTAGLDPNGVWAGDLVWQQGVAKFGQEAVIPVLKAAYAEHFDEDFAFTHRPYVQQHLRTVHNRLAKVPGEVFDEIREELSKGTLAGESIPAIAARVEGELLSAGSETWKGRATVVARTETIGAYNGGTNDAFQAVEEVLDVPMEKIWLATEDTRTRHTHREADGQRVPLNSAFTVGGASLEFPGDPTGPPQEIIQCRCTMLLVEPGGDVDMSDRQLLADAAFHLQHDQTTYGRRFGVAGLTLAAALTAAVLAPDLAVLEGFDHSLCTWEFCRTGTAPGEKKVHPGPCRGWKATLKEIAPGVYKALESARLEKLEAKRKAKIKELKDAGKPIPKALLKPATLPEPKKQQTDPEIGQLPPISPETDAKLAKVQEKVKHEFDPEVVAAKKKAAQEKAIKLAEEEAQKKAAQAQALAPPLVDSDKPKTPAGFVPTTEQGTAIEMAKLGDLVTPESRAEAYAALISDDFAELPAADQAAIAADMAVLAYHPDLPPVTQGIIKSKYLHFTGEAIPPPKPSTADAPPAPGIKTGPPPVDKPAAKVKAEQILGSAGKEDDGTRLIAGYSSLSKEEFDSLPFDTKAKLVADLMRIRDENPGPVAIGARDWYKNFLGKEMPEGSPPGGKESGQPNKTEVPGTPASVESPAAAKAATMAMQTKQHHWKDRLIAYSELTQADVDQMSDDDLNAIAADLTGLQAWFKKKNLVIGLKAVDQTLNNLSAKVDKKTDPPPAPNLPPSPPIEAPAPAPPKPLNGWQQKAIDGLANPSVNPADLANHISGLTPQEFKGLPPGAQAKAIKLLEAQGAQDNASAKVWKKAYENLTGQPHPSSGHAVSTAPAATPAVDQPQLPGMPVDTKQAWAAARQALTGKSFKGTNKVVADRIKNGTVSGRLGAYQDIVKDQAGFKKLPLPIQQAIVADLDNIVAAGPDVFTPEAVEYAGKFRNLLTGKPPGSPLDQPTTGQPKAFPSAAAEKAHHVANSPAMHTNQQRLNAYKKLSAASFKKLPPETQQKIADDLDAINGSPSATVLESNQALSAHLKLTGVPVGEFNPAVLNSTPTAKKSKLSQNAQDAKAEVDNGKPLGYYSPNSEYVDKFLVYDALSTEEFESLPVATQKAIVKDVGAMQLTKSPVDKGTVNALASKLVGSHHIPYNWKPKTAAQKKAEKLAQMSPAEMADLQKTSTDSQEFKEKLKKAVTGVPALKSVPYSTASGANTPPAAKDLRNAPTVDGYTGAQQYEAVDDYKGSDYHAINGVLRDGKGNPTLTGYTGGRIRRIDAAMQNSRLPVPVEVWRGTGTGKGIFGDALKGDLTGVEWTEHGYGSTSTAQHTAKSFAGGQNGGGLLMRVFIPPGPGAVNVSQGEFESEILLQRGLRWRVVADHGRVPPPAGHRRIDVEVIYP